MHEPRPISTAPMDGTVILTECGFVRYIDPEQWASPVERGWACCDPGGYFYYDGDDDHVMAEPTLWRPLPDWR